MTTTACRSAIAVGAVLTAAYFAMPNDAWQDAIYVAMGLASVVCMIVGVRMHHPAQRWAWFALAASNLCFVGGDVVLSFYELVLHREIPFPSISDALYLLGYPFLVVAVVGLTRSKDGPGRRANRTDAAIVTLGALALVWQVLMGSYQRDVTLSVFGRVVTMAYPVTDTGVLFIVLAAMFAASRKRPEVRLVALGLGSMMIADLGYDVLVLHGAYHTGNPLDAGWLISYTLLGAAALHPSMGIHHAAATLRSYSRRRLPFVALAGFIAPTVLLVDGVRRDSVDMSVLAGTSILLFALIILRVNWLLARLREKTLALSEQTHTLGEALASQLALEHDLRYQAFHDSLTGLANRALLHDRVEHALAASLRASGTVAVLFCDLDGFKTVNDSLGHNVGDELLVVVGKRLCSVVRTADTVARLGGDEFAILMDNVDDPSIALTIAERVVSVLRQPIEVAQQLLTLSASVGVSFGDVGKSVELLLSEADSAMYEAKTRGKDRVEIFREAMRTSIVYQMGLRNSFAEGLQCGEFYLQYQPSVSLHDSALEGFEALVRWRHPVYGDVAPGDFISLAEKTGFIIPMGRWVLEAACAAAATWGEPNGQPLYVAVNVSGRQIENSHFVDDVRAAVSYSGIRPDRLVLEITESVLMLDPAETARTLERLKEMGVRIAIDDFGTGYSSLSYLHLFPIDIIKIDRSFVEPLTDPTSEAIAFVATIIRLAHQLQLRTVAEGIEDETQRRNLIRLECDSAQGFLISRPLDTEVALDLTLTREPQVKAATLT